MHLAQPRLLLLEPTLQLVQLPVSQLGGATEIGGTLGALRVVLHLLHALLDVGDGADGALLLLPARAQACGAFLQVGELTLQRGQPLYRRLVGLLAQRLALDLELTDLAFHDIELRWQ